MADIIKQTVNVPALETEYSKMYEEVYSRCKNCPIVQQCTFIQPTLNSIKKDINTEFKEKCEMIKKEYPGTMQQQVMIDDEKKNATKYFEHKIKLLDIKCQYERDVAVAMLKELDNKYDFIESPELKFLAYDLVRHRIRDFKIDLISANEGVVQVYYDKMGNRMLKLTPGLHYNIEISKVSADIIKKMDEIKFGTKNTNVDIKVDLSSQIIEAYNKRKELKKNEN